MSSINITAVVLLGFRNLQEFNILLFLLLLLLYLLTISGNLLLILLSTCKRVLRSPMYVFLTQLSVADIVLTTNIIPNVLCMLLDNGETAVSFTGCIVQFYLFGVSEATECLLLTVMAYDRYLAICKPLQYTCMMNRACCIRLIMASWVLSFSLMLIETLNICKLRFCGPHIVDHFFCDFKPLVRLSCSDTYRVTLEVALLCIPVIVCPFLIIILSYIYIVVTVLKIQSINGRQKAFSTCSAHITVVSVFYGTLIGIYALPTQGGQTSKVLSLIYTVGTPFLNPIIYSLRNNDIKRAILSLSFPSQYLSKERHV